MCSQVKLRKVALSRVSFGYCILSCHTLNAFEVDDSKLIILKIALEPLFLSNRSSVGLSELVSLFDSDITPSALHCLSSDSRLKVVLTKPHNEAVALLFVVTTMDEKC